jgi:RNA polymerase sigma-70 factor (ECF subfamily)
MRRDEFDDGQLMAQAAAGDPGALEALYERYAPAVMGLALRITGDAPAAEDVVQETFWRAWRHAASFRAARGSPIAWLCSIARNLAIDLWRRRQAGPRPDDEAALDMAPDPAADVAEAAWTAARSASVRAALRSLPEAQRRVIELAYFRGLTRQEIATVTGEPLGTIHTRARLALQKLREALQNQGLDD